MTEKQLQKTSLIFSHVLQCHTVHDVRSGPAAPPVYRGSAGFLPFSLSHLITHLHPAVLPECLLSSLMDERKQKSQLPPRWVTNLIGLQGPFSGELAVSIKWEDFSVGVGGSAITTCPALESVL